MMISYPHYKEARLDWLNKIPSHWNELRAKYIFRHVDERSQTGEEELLSVSHITGVTPRSEKNVTMFMAESYVGHKLCQPGDLVINSLWAWMAALGISNYTGIVSSAYGVYRLLQPDRFVPKYLDYLLRTKGYAGEYLCRSKGIWTSRLLLTPESFLDIPVIIPPVAEQKVIVAFLDGKVGEIDAFVARKRQLITLLQEQKQAVINRAVTQGLDSHAPRKPSGLPWLGDIPAHWKTIRLKNIAPVIQTGPFGSQLHASDYIEGGIPVINPIHMQELTIVPDHKTTVDEETQQRLSRHKLSEGDIIFARRGELGRCALVTQQENGWLCGTGSMKLSFKRNLVNSEYMAILLSTRGICDWLSLESVGATMDNVNTSILANLPLPLPPKAEQSNIVEYINTESAIIVQAVARAEQEIELIEAYRTSLIAHAVTGKVDVRSV